MYSERDQSVSMGEVKHCCIICLDDDVPANLQCPHVTEAGNPCSFSVHSKCYLDWQQTRALNAPNGSLQEAECFYKHPLGLDFSMEVRCMPTRLLGLNVSRSTLALAMHFFYLEMTVPIVGLLGYTLIMPLWFLLSSRENNSDPGLVYVLVLCMAQAATALPSLIFATGVGRHHVLAVVAYVGCLNLVQALMLRRLGLRDQQVSRCIWGCMSIGIMSTLMWHLCLAALLNGLLGLGLGMNTLSIWIARIITMRAAVGTDESYIQYLYSSRWPGITLHRPPNTLATIHSKLTSKKTLV